MDFPVDDDASTGSEMYTTAREFSEDEGTDSAYATPRAHSIPPSYSVHPLSRLHVPGSFQEGSGALTPMSVQPTNDVGVAYSASPEENFPMGDAHPGQSTPRATLGDDDDDDMHDQDSVRHLLDGDNTRNLGCQHEDDEMNGLEDLVETHGRNGASERAVRQRRDHELAPGGLRGEVAYWKDVSKYRRGQNKELKKQYAEAASRWQEMQKQNDVTIGKLQEQTAQLMAFMNSKRAATESELQDKVQAKEARIAIEEAQAQLVAKQVEQDKIAAHIHEQEALLAEREAAVEKQRAAVENEQATVSRLLQQARAESTRPCNAAPRNAAPPPRNTASSTRAAFPRSDTTPRSRSNPISSSTRMFLTAIPECMNDQDHGASSESDGDAPPTVLRLSSDKSNGDIEIHTLTVNQLMEAIRQTLRKEFAEKTISSPRLRRGKSATPTPELDLQVNRETRIELLRRVRELYKKHCRIETDKDWHAHQHMWFPLLYYNRP
ncbi:hypothetical protein GSI_07580 [Ganoderma sinense ZZ0214-1]|uniref:Uncharacterized protein n=1 Tax=Ganoderma sinense ZZ0214-1 TaxID=1077348 RepID=A0A2G8S9E9_9APHY|nr:hypothetical protein GSI_07580 [Ganoderma sinense ZZ0214-1]